MPNLTTKELAGLSDQLDFEKVLCCKYQAAAQECTEADLKNCFQQCHFQRYRFLKRYCRFQNFLQFRYHHLR